MSKSNLPAKEYLSGETGFQVATETWNMSDGYVKLKILRQSVLWDKYEILAIYGVEELEDEGTLVNPESIPQRRINAIYRLKDNAKQLFSNCEFKIKPEDRIEFLVLEKRLKLAEEYLNGVGFMTEDPLNHQQFLKINERFFNVLFNEFQEIKQNLHKLMNNAGLIFRQSEDVDFDDVFKGISEGG